MKINGLRFIIGIGCNYDCFYCHHEGCFLYNDSLDLSIYEHKIKLLYDFCIKNKIYEIAITGGEPFLYLERLKVLFKYFSKYPFHIVVNSNASLIIKHINYLKQLENKIEFHINFSSLNKKTHEKIINKKLFEEEFNSLNLLKETKHIIKLNIICLKTINENELVDINKFALRNGFIPRYLVFYDTKKLYSNLVMNEQEICNIFNAKIVKRFSYGIILATGDYDIEIVKCLCIDKECEICKKNTFLHLDPNLNLKYCIDIENVVQVDFTDIKTISNSFNKANKKLKEI